MEDLKVVADILRPFDFMCKIDLKDAYFAVPIHLAHQKLLCFQFKNVTYQFKCLPFGLTSAPRVFTKVLKPLVAYVRRLGLRICIYIDDMLILNSQREGAIRDASLMIYLLENLGFVVNMDKSILLPSQEMEFLGVLVNSITMNLSLPDNKVLNLQEGMQKSFKFQECFPVRSSTLNWKNGSSKGSCFPGSTPLQSTSTLEEFLRPPGSSPPSEGNSRHRGSIRPRLVDNQPAYSQLQASETPPSKYAYPIGCFRVGLGGGVQWDRDKGNLVSSRILTSHKLPGAAGSHLCNQGLHQIPEQCPCPNTNGQHISYSLCKQNGGSQEERVRQTCSFPLGVVPREEDHSSSGAHPRSTECCGRCRVSSKTRCSGLEARFKSVQGSESQFRSLYDRPFCQQEQHSVGEILQLSARSPSGTVRCPSSTLEERECLRLPPF